MLLVQVLWEGDGIVADTFRVMDGMMAPAARAYFKPISDRSRVKGYAVSRCHLVKHVSCRMGSGPKAKRYHCAVKKMVRCHSICQHIGYNTAGTIQYGGCRKDLCQGGPKGVYGEMACRKQAETV